MTLRSRLLVALSAASCIACSTTTVELSKVVVIPDGHSALLWVIRPEDCLPCRTSGYDLRMWSRRNPRKLAVRLVVVGARTWETDHFIEAEALQGISVYADVDALSVEDTLLHMPVIVGLRDGKVQGKVELMEAQPGDSSNARQIENMITSLLQ